jgi:hypothetical protein
MCADFMIYFLIMLKYILYADLNMYLFPYLNVYLFSGLEVYLCTNLNVRFKYHSHPILLSY